MLNSATRPLLHLRSLLRLRPLVPATSLLSQRNFSVQAIYSTFPASLLRYSPRQKSSLFNIKDLEQRGDDPYDDAVRVSTNNLVYPGAEESSSCKISPFYQETAREYLGS